MKKFLLSILELILFYLTIGGVTAYIDYMRMSTGEVPFFSLKQYNKSNEVETYNSFIYTASRKTSNIKDQTLYNSKNINYKLFYMMNLSVPNNWQVYDKEYVINGEEDPNCQGISQFYYAGEGYNIYTYCLKDITIQYDEKTSSLKDLIDKDKEFIYTFEDQFAYNGLFVNNSAFEMTMKQGVVGSKLKLYHCHKDNMSDYYIGPESMTYQADFCTIKEIPKVEEESNQ